MCTKAPTRAIIIDRAPVGMHDFQAMTIDIRLEETAYLMYALVSVAACKTNKVFSIWSQE